MELLPAVGQLTDPHVINSWLISAFQSSGIRLENTQAHFIIKDVYILGNGSHAFNYDGISLSNVANARVENTKIENISNRGIVVHDSTYVAISGNSIRNSARQGTVQDRESSRPILTVY